MSDSSITEVSKSGASSGGPSEASQIGVVKQWLDHEFGQAGKEVPQFEYTPRSVAYSHNLATLSQAKTQASKILASDFRLKASEYRAQGLFTEHIYICLFRFNFVMQFLEMVVIT